MNDNTTDLINNISQLQWACRRGMLELDVLLGNFLKEAYQDLIIEDKERFVRLLKCTDPELFAWLMEKETPSDPDLEHIIKKVIMHARLRFQS